MVASMNQSAPRAARRWNSIVGGARRRLSRLGALLSSAGRVERPEFEQLEQRQLLFALTITPEMVDPITGVGTIRAYFGYAIPYLANTSEPADAQQEEVEEEFSASTPGVPGTGAAVVPQFFQWQSGFAVRHNLAVAPVALAGMRLVEETLDPEGDNEVQVIMQGGQEFTLSLTQFNIPVELFAMTIRGGFNTSNFTVELISDGQVIATLTGAQLAALAVPPAGEERRFTFTPPAGFNTFDQIRFVANPGAPTMTFRFDDLFTALPPRPFDPILSSRLFGAAIAFTGPAGATVEFFDLYDRPMRQTIAVSEPPNVPFPILLIDPDGNGIPNFNDGIGRIVLSNVNHRSALTMWGAELGVSTTPPTDIDFAQGPFWLRVPNVIAGLFDDFESAGFGYAARPEGAAWSVTGLPPGSGSLIIGSPFHRPLDNYNVAGIVTGTGTTVTGGFNNLNQGIFITDGSNMGSVYVHAVLHGSSQFSGFVETLVIGYLMGSVAVAGDLGSMFVSSDAGLWVDDEGRAPNGALAIKSQSQLVVGRTLGQLRIDGRSLVDVTVIGDLDSTNLHHRDVLRYYEREYMTDLIAPNTVRSVIRNILNNNAAGARNDVLGELGFFFARIDQARVTGMGLGRNDTVMTAEWVGSIGTAVQIYGDLGRRDIVNTAADPSDVYGFAVDGTQDVLVQLEGPLIANAFGLYMRIVDSDGRTVAAPQVTPERRNFVSMRFRPDAPGVYYLVVQTQATGTAGQVASYVLNLSGMAATTLGAYRTGAGSGNIAGGLSNNINVLSGSMGAIITDIGFLSGGGQPADVTSLFNVSDSEDPLWRGLNGSTISVDTHLYNVLAGHGIGTPFLPVVFNIGGHLGYLRTALAGTADARIGDMRYTEMSIGGSIGMLDIRGGLGIDQSGARPHPTDLSASVLIRTGTDPLLRGDIGFIRVGSHVGGDTLIVRTSDNSVVGGFVVSQDVEFDEGDIDYGIYAAGGLANGVTFNLGSNSDLRFFDTPRIDQFQVRDYTLPIPTGAQGLELTDDAGGRVRLQILGGTGVASGSVRMLAVSQSLGVAIGRIQVNLEGGATLQITSLGAPGNQHVVSIGRISVRGSEEGSAIRITGTSQVDVWQVVHEDGEDFNEIVNTTPFGDIVAIDMAGLNRIQLGSGSLGRTQMPAWGPQLIGPFLGITRGAGSAVGEEIPLPAAAMTGWWTQTLYRPVNQSNFGSPPNSWLDDVGSPFDPYLNGAIVRDGGLVSVEARGAIGDVIVPQGTINNVNANMDGITPFGRFDGIVGNIHALRIGRVDIGDGLAARPASAPLAPTGITALDDINIVVGTRIPGANIASNIIAANITPGNADPATFPTNGIARVELRGGGQYVNAWIGATPLDAFWSSFRAPDDSAYTGTIDQIVGTNANFLRSEVTAFTFNTMRLTGGFFDASIVHIANHVQRIEAAGFRNSTLGGGELEFHENRITVGGDINVLTTTARAGDINDLHVDVGRRIGEVSARNISRSRIEADVEINRFETVQDLRSSEVVTGMLTTGMIGRSIRSSQILVAGPLIALTVSDSITNTDISATGPDGRIDTITVANLLSGSIFAAGPIGTITVTQGDMVADIRTVVNQRGQAGNIGLLSAGRDLDIRTDVAGTINRLVAGRHIGNRANPSIILVRGSILDVSIPNGQLYSDLRVADRVENVTIGSVVNQPGNSILGAGSIIAFGRIENITIEGDFAGDIISYSGGIGVITINNGSFLPGGLIAAYDGTLTNLFINSGNLYGNVHADYHILAIRLNGSEDGVFGHVGINPSFSAGTPYSPTRNQHPPGVIATSAVQGPRITAGHNFGRLILTNGSIFEALIYAGRAIGTIEVGGDIRNDTITSGPGTVIAAGSSIFTVRSFGNVSDTMILVGVRDFGANGRPGGIGANADTVESGRLQTVDIRGNANNVIVSAGMDPGSDGMYNTADDMVVMGISFVREVLVGGVVNNVTVFADSATLSASPGVVRAGHDFVQRDPDLHPGGPVGVEIPASIDGTAVFSFTSLNGESGTIRFIGPGRAFWDEAGNRIVLLNTSLLSELFVTSNTSRLTDFAIVSNDNASMGRVQVDANLFGDSRIVIDAYVIQISTWDLHDNSTIRVGMNVRNITTGSIHGGSINALFWARDIQVNGSFGTPADFDEARIDALAANSITITGNNAALVNIVRDLGSFTVNGAMDRAQFRSGASVNAFTAGSLSETRISVRDRLGPVIVNGNVHDTAIQAGGDLGSSVLPGQDNGTSTGHIASVVIAGNLTRSSIVAGLLRGPDGFFGTTDDFVAPGRSTIGDVTIGGTAQGSNLNSEQYRIVATGPVGTVTINGAPGASQGNFQIRRLETEPTPIRVLDLRSTAQSNVWIMWIHFNQEINESTVGPALTVSEVRRDPENLLIQFPLVQGVDYTLTPFDVENNRIGVVFARHVTDRNLDDATGEPGNQPGPGVYRFHLSADVLRASVVNARLAGDREGFGNSSRDFSGDAIVGDAGDKLEPGIVVGSDERRVDFYGPFDLDLVLDNNYEPDGVPDPNTVVTIRGRIGDHPDHGGIFRVAGDADIYKITLRAGQILRLGGMEGSANFASRLLVNELGEVQFGTTPSAIQLPAGDIGLTDFTFDDHYLIKETGTYFIVITNHDFWDAPDVIPTVNQASGTVGDYRFTLEVFDDGDSGFKADTESGNGTAVVNAPAAIVFAGPSGVFGTEDDRSEVVIGRFVFHLDPGPDGIRGTADDIVVGSNGDGIVSRREGNQLTSQIESAIGPRGFTGVPGVATPDVDVYHLNNRQPIAPGQLITIKVKLAELGSDLGSFTERTFSDFRGNVQFGVFDTTGAQGIDDALLIFAPTDFLPIAGPPGQLASQGASVYGFDENGDFFITFVTPGRIDGAATQEATYAVYIQGVFNTDYGLEIVQTDAPQGLPSPRAKQNVFIETRGGFIDWLEAGGLTTQLAGFNGGVLGFTGNVNGRPVEQYIVENVIFNLQSIFDAAGVHVNISDNPSHFEFQDFSKVFLTSTTDPITIFNTNNFGYSQHSDPFNLDRNDEAVIFMPSFATLGYTGSRADIDTFILSLTAAVGRRVGELVGLRTTASHFPFFDDRDIMSANSVQFVDLLGGSYAFLGDSRPLSSSFDVLSDTGFFLGRQNSLALLQRFISPRP